MAMPKLLKEMSREQAEITLDSRTTNTMADILSRVDRLGRDSALNKYADFCDEEIYNLEKQTSHIDRLRRENIVISGIPDRVSQEEND